MPSRRDLFNPAEAYVDALGDGQSKKRVIQLLNQISRFFGAADLHAMEWQMLTYDHVLAFRETRVRSGLSPATINLQLSVIKMTCKQCWLKNLMPLQTYAAIKEVKSVRGGRVPKGRAPQSPPSRDVFSRPPRPTATSARSATPPSSRSRSAAGFADPKSPLSFLSRSTTCATRSRSAARGNKERRVAVADAVWERLAVWLEARAGDPCPNVFLAVRRYGRISTATPSPPPPSTRSSRPAPASRASRTSHLTTQTNLRDEASRRRHRHQPRAKGHGPRLRPHHPALRQARGRGGRGGDEKNPHLTQPNGPAQVREDRFENCERRRSTSEHLLQRFVLAPVFGFGLGLFLQDALELLLEGGLGDEEEAHGEPWRSWPVSTTVMPASCQ